MKLILCMRQWFSLADTMFYPTVMCEHEGQFIIQKFVVSFLVMYPLLSNDDVKCLVVFTTLQPSTS